MSDIQKQMIEFSTMDIVKSVPLDIMTVCKITKECGG